MTSKHLILHRTHRSLSGCQKNFSEFTFRSSEYKDLSSIYFSLTATKSAHSIKICFTAMIVFHATQARGSTFFQKEGMSQIRMTNISSNQNCLFPLSYKMITVCPEALVKSHEACWILRQLHPFLSVVHESVLFNFFFFFFFNASCQLYELFFFFKCAKIIEGHLFVFSFTIVRKAVS